MCGLVSTPLKIMGPTPCTCICTPKSANNNLPVCMDKICMQKCGILWEYWLPLGLTFWPLMLNSKVILLIVQQKGNVFIFDTVLTNKRTEPAVIPWVKLWPCTEGQHKISVPFKSHLTSQKSQNSPILRA